MPDARAALQQLDALGIREWTPPAGGAVRLARLRIDSGLRLPDRCVLYTAMVEGAPIATFDDRLALAVESLGVEVAGRERR